MTDTKADVKSLVTDALNAEAAKTSVSLEKKDVAKVSAAVTHEVSAVVNHATNNEPWWASRVTWGSIIAVIAGVAGVLGYTLDAEAQAELVSLIVAGSAIVSGVLSFYGRWIARKPIGS